MSTEAVRPSLHEIGYRLPILAVGACWGLVPAVVVGLDLFAGLPPTQGLFVVATLVTVSLGALYEFDSRRLDQYGDGVPLAWSYAFVAPISIVLWNGYGPTLAAIPGIGMLALLVGPPASALLYVWQRGRVARVDRVPAT